ncbi:MAG: tautomerase family protein [Alphaproteobacteria bacterium]|nr:tautomerase family protein [Alphaproteobacteria bacterium]
MPLAQIHLLKGHSRAALKGVVSGVTEAMSRVLQSPLERFIVWVTEVDTDLWGVAGRPATEALGQSERAAVEVPFVQMVLMEGRTREQIHGVMDAVSAAIAQALQSDKSRVRVHIIEAQPDHWGIGGVPYAILRADEIAARKAAKASGPS